MDFETFQSACKWAFYGFDEEKGFFEMTCRKPGCIPKGESWGVCHECCCPYFAVVRGMQTTNKLPRAIEKPCYDCGYYGWDMP